ncbi:MAG: hypothetical protein ACO1RX_20685 [Candidatus Sericytochromatia bacterium]
MLKPLLAPILGLLTAVCFTSCGVPGMPGPQDPPDPAVGSQISTQDIVGYFPTPRPGMRYVYVSTEKKGQVTLSNRAELEVLSVQGTQVKLGLKVGNEDKQTDVDTARPPLLPAGGMNFVGRENVTVPAGTFSALKLSFSQDNKSFNVWAVRGIGVLQTLEQRPNQETMTIQLESYQLN